MSLRSELTKEFLEFVDDMDPSGRNTQRYNELFMSLDDKKFYKLMNDFFNDDKKNIAIAYRPFDNPVNSDFIHHISEKHKLDLYEYVYMPYLNNNLEDPPGTIHEVLVMDYPIPRLQQMVFKKNNTTTSITHRNIETGQVTDSDKVSRVTDLEAYSLIVMGQYDAGREFYTLRSDDMEMKAQALKQIARDGELSLDELHSDTLNKKTINTINYYMLGAGLKTNLIDSSGYLLPATIKANEEKDVTIERK